MNNNNDTKVRILDIQRMSTEDGPGIRTTVFFKGCSLKCAWCHNPESISFTPSIEWYENRCIGCKRCVEICPKNAVAFSEEGLAFDRDKCALCGKCANQCPAQAIVIKGREMSRQELLHTLLKDKAYYDKSGGGVTFSGGEALMQPNAVFAMINDIKSMGIHVAIDTAGYIPFQIMEKVAELADLILYDLKIMDEAAHIKYTAKSNDLIKKNLLILGDHIRKNKRPVLWIRTPIIPGATDSIQNITAIGEFIHQNLPGLVERWELCSFNNLCKDKYLRLDLSWTYASCGLMTKEQMDELTACAKLVCKEPHIVQWTGSTAIDLKEEC